MRYVLDGIKVVDATQNAAGPLAGRLMADWGAEVIHVEPPKQGDLARYVGSGMVQSAIVQPASYAYGWELFNSNKKSLAIDLGSEMGKEIIHKLLAKADVFLSNHRPYELKKFDLEYETLSKLNPRLIFASLTGYGRQGPDADLPGFEGTSYFTRAGISHMMMEPGSHPPHFRPGFGDNITGMALAFGVAMALYDREKTGRGQEVDVSLYNTGVWALATDISGALATGKDWQGIRREDVNAGLNLYQTKDGRWLQITLTPVHWPKFLGAIKREDLVAKLKEPEVILRNFEETFKSKTLAEWKVVLDGIKVPWGPVQNLTEVINDPQAAANGFFTDFNHPKLGKIRLVANPIKLSQSKSDVRTPAPELGEHTREIILGLGYAEAELEEMKKSERVK